MLCHIQLNLYGSRICLTLVFLFCVLLKNKLNAKISKGDTMLYDFIIIDKTSSAPLYMQIYASIRRSVENGSLVKNTKLPSVRQLSSGLEVSKPLYPQLTNNFALRVTSKTSHKADIMLRHSLKTPQRKAKIRTAPQSHRLKDMTTISAAKALTIKSLILTNGKSMSKR